MSIKKIRKFKSIDEIHKIWNNETFILYNQITRLMLRAHVNLTTEQEEKLFPEIPDYAIINDKVYELEENSHLEWTPFRDVDGCSYCEIELTQINDVDEINNIIESYTSEQNTVHELKIAPEYFKKVLSKEKSFELRYNDRNYKVGDILKLKEYDNGQYTDRETSVKIIYILQDFEGLKNNYAILAIKPL